MIFPRSSLRSIPFIIAFLIFASFLIATSSLWGSRAVSSGRGRNVQLDATAHATTHLIKTQVEVYAQTLYGARAFINASDNVTRADWDAYYQTVGVGRRLEAMSGLAYIERVGSDEKDQFLRQLQQDTTLQAVGYEDFSLKPDSFKSEYYFVKLLAPSNTERMKGTVGFDITSEETRRNALERARDSDQAILTGPITSPTQRLPAFALYVPVYDRSLPSRTTEERRVAIQGAVAMGFEIERLFSLAFEDLAAKNVRVQVYDGPEVNAERLLFDTLPEGIMAREVSTAIRTLDVAGQTWTLEFQTPQTSQAVTIQYLWARVTFVIFTNSATALGVWYWVHTRRRLVS